VTIDTSWGDFGFDNANHCENPFENSVGLSNVANLQRKWSVSSTTGLEDSPVCHGTVYFVTPDGLLNAYNAITGNLIWQFTPTIGFPNYSSPLVDPSTGLVFFGTVSNFSPDAPSPFYALDAQTGNLKWTLTLSSNEYGFPTLASQTTYFGTSHEKGPGTVLALDEFAGALKWSYATNGGVGIGRG
jgi:outer membrane protein assembly factor BamB